LPKNEGLALLHSRALGATVVEGAEDLDAVEAGGMNDVDNGTS